MKSLQRLLLVVLTAIIVVLAVILNPVRFANASNESSIGSEELLRAVFDRPAEGLGMVIKRTKKSGSAELCGDTCDFFSWTNARSAEEVWDFIAMFEYYRGIGSQLEGVVELYKSHFTAKVAELLSRYKELCPSPQSENDAVSCVLQKLATRSHIRVGFVNYDEGNRCLAWGDVSNPQKISEYKCVPAADRK